MNGIFAQLPGNSVHIGRLVANGSAVGIYWMVEEWSWLIKLTFLRTAVVLVCVCMCARNTTIVDRISSFQW